MCVFHCCALIRDFTEFSVARVTFLKRGQPSCSEYICGSPCVYVACIVFTFSCELFQVFALAWYSQAFGVFSIYFTVACALLYFPFL